MSFFFIRDYDESIGDLNELSIIEEHKKLAKHQREVFNKQRKDEKLLQTNILLTIDFKASIPLGII